eukprot:TRINITY_DN16074_c0_g1_i1.p1 TRINITY_DN16074_c0_g1~~TRINITY_DN16074_c0_g1_i1.p1  ORF type:complete len:1107 (+),score=513.53 TRINITY_DN16074_c0_g1_i1:67-3387(+)
MAMKDPRGILDFTQPIDVVLFDEVCRTAYPPGGGGGGTPEHNMALRTLEEFRMHPNAWTRADTILGASQVMEGKFIALQTLDDTIKKNWNVIDVQQQLGIRNFVINKIMELAESSESLVKNRFVVEKMNHTLVEILKRDWPTKWPSFVEELVLSAQKSNAVMQNNLAIVRELSEEVFDFSKGKMTAQQIQIRKEELNKQFSQIYQMLSFVLLNKQDTLLIKEALRCLLSCLSWIPFGYIFETDLVNILCNRFLPVLETRSLACRCLTEIASLELNPTDPATAQYNAQFRLLLLSFMKHLKTMIPCSPANCQEALTAFEASSEANGEFAQNASQLLTCFHRSHLQQCHTAAESDPEVLASVKESHVYLLGLTCVDNKEMLKACVEYWRWLAEMVFNMMQQPGAPQAYGGYWMQNQQMTPQQQLLMGLYADPGMNIFSETRKAFVRLMARPEEVIVFEDENGEVIKEPMKDVDAIELYNTMREALVFFTHLDPKNTAVIMQSKIEQISRVVAGNPQLFVPGHLNTLSWAIGSISGAMSHEAEKDFLIAVLKELLTICQNNEGQANKASVASDIMYVIGQYPRFLKESWKFLTIVMNKLFDFMREKFEGVQDMAVETFLKITNQCKDVFVALQPGESATFVEGVLEPERLRFNTELLEPKQVCIYFEAVGLMIGAAPPETQEALAERLLAVPNQTWNAILQKAGTTEPQIIQNTDVMGELSFVLKRHVCVAATVGDGYRSQLYKIFTGMMHLYDLYSQFISKEIAEKGVQIARYTHVKKMRIVKKDILKLIEEYVNSSQHLDDVAKTILPPLIQNVLSDYRNSVVQARNPQVLSLITALIKKLTVRVEAHIPEIFDAILQCTLEMIMADLTGFPDIRNNFFKLIQTLNGVCFESFLKALQAYPAIMEAMVSAMNHTDPSVEVIGLETLETFLEHLSASPVLFDFHEVYFVFLLNAVFGVLLDTLHKTGFKYHCRILKRMITDVKRITEAGRCISSTQPPGSQASEYLKHYLSEQLSQRETLKASQIRLFVDGLFTKTTDDKAYKSHIRDFLVELNEFAAEENTQLFDDKEFEAAAKQAEQAKRMAVPGIAPQMKAADVMHVTHDDGGMH